ncbi:ISL3 family transposase [Streptosporangium sp. NPDC000509]|uniref:ISL3 family transposase n=1 Tax=Streptosporangium sp. NPDC000509 TaxID=3366186 RepID=UPI0036A7826B
MEELVDRSGYVLIQARTGGAPALCPGCRAPSTRLHGHYRRLLQDLPTGGRQILINLTVRRLKCGNPTCQIRTFAEPISSLARRHARNTSLLRRMLERFALALAGRAATRLLGLLGVTVSRDTLIRLIRALPDPEIGQVTVLGVDDWAKRRGHSYATLLVNMETGRPIDVLDDRQADTFAAWLREHPGIEVICRDRAGAYAEGSRTGAPDAIEVADRWHLWNNLCKATEAAVRTHRSDLPEPEPEPVPRPAAPAVIEPKARPESHTAARTRERHAIVRELAERGMTISAISQRLGLDRKTVRKFVSAATAEHLINGPRSRTRSFEEFVPYLRQRVTEDEIINAAQLYAELRERGYRGSRRTVRRYLEPLRAAVTTPDLPPPPPTVRETTRWITSHPDHLTNDENTRLKAVLARSPHLSALARHVTAFAQMMSERSGQTDLKAWLAAVDADDIPQLHSFARGIERDLDAVTNGLSLPYSSGAVEGNVTRVKALKRSRYGRANLDLLRKIILCSH